MSERVYLLPWHGCGAPSPVRDVHAHLQHGRLRRNLGVLVLDVVRDGSLGVEVIDARILALGPFRSVGERRPDEQLERLNRRYRVRELLPLLDFRLVAPLANRLAGLQLRHEGVRGRHDEFAGESGVPEDGVRAFERGFQRRDIVDVSFHHLDALGDQGFALCFRGVACDAPDLVLGILEEGIRDRSALD